MKGKSGPMKGVAPKVSMPVVSRAAKAQVLASAKERKHGGKVMDMDMDMDMNKMKVGKRLDRKPRKKGGAVFSAAAAKAPMAMAAK